MKEFGELALRDPNARRKVRPAVFFSPCVCVRLTRPFSTLQAAVAAEEDTLLMGISGREFIRRDLEWRQQCLDDSVRALKSTVWFRQWPDDALLDLAAEGKVVEYPPGAVMVQQGRLAEGFVVVVVGHAKEVRRLSNRTDKLGVVHREPSTFKIAGAAAAGAAGAGVTRTSTASAAAATAAVSSTKVHPAANVDGLEPVNDTPLTQPSRKVVDIRTLSKSDAFGLTDLPLRLAGSLSHMTSSSGLYSSSIVASTRVDALFCAWWLLGVTGSHPAH